jgi:septal ring factor EnvC (AmiA/AmiB activator)
VKLGLDHILYPSYHDTVIPGEVDILDKVKRLEEKIKDLNALKADYRKELDEAQFKLSKKEIDKEHFDKVKDKVHKKEAKINAKIIDLRQKVEALKKGGG